ncbi:MAG: hypothetical protein OEY56_02780, partial [Cyclobacteriaceae bacterium]|nr:hypothetical protein [Cyclobacteriaceae bacterium]
MEVKDIFIAPIYIILLSLLAYLARPMVTNAKTRKYFLPGLWAKMLGAVAVGMIYQFYYDGGDTFNYFTNGSRWIWEAFLADPVSGFKLLMESGGSRHMDTFAYSQHIWYYRDPNSYFVVRLTAFFDLFTFHTYAATALLFASFSFSGMWAFFMALVNRYPAHVKWIAVAVLFIPSTLFWGSGIMKDTLTLGALGWLTFGMIKIIEEKKRTFFYWIVVTLSIGLIYEIKPYILICYLPLIFVWLYWKNILTIRNKVTRVFIAPVLLALFGFMAYGVMKQISGETQKYSLENIAEQAMITSYDIRYGWGARMGGDG